MVIQSLSYTRGCSVWGLGFFSCSIGDTLWITVNENLYDLCKHLFHYAAIIAFNFAGSLVR